jgi:hypothetical protein
MEYAFGARQKSAGGLEVLMGNALILLIIDTIPSELWPGYFGLACLSHLIVLGE